MNANPDASMSTRPNILIEVFLTRSVYAIKNCFPSKELSSLVLSDTDKLEITSKDEAPDGLWVGSGDCLRIAHFNLIE